MPYIWKNNQAKETHIGREDEGRGGREKTPEAATVVVGKKGRKKSQTQ
jgi:hypothetical protein